MQPDEREAGDGGTLIALLCTDLGGITRGRSRPARDRAQALRSGVGWVPINQSISPFDHIPDSPLWGSHGDRRLLPDPDTHVRVDLGLGAPALELYLCDIVQLDGTPWDVCARSVLKQSLADFRKRTSCELRVSFEHEFTFVDQQEPTGPGFSLRCQRIAEPFGTRLMDALWQAGQDPETFLPEFGAGQFEVTCRPAPALAAADRSVLIRELTHETARQMNRRLTFSPIVKPGGIGNGVHIHLSIVDESGHSRTYDAKGPGRLSKLAGAFAAGIVEQLPSITAFTAPSVLSYQRLVPHKWAAAYACLGERNREAALRICPTVDFPGMDPQEQLHLEFRACDATANPYLALNALVRAGLHGIDAGLEAPPLVNSDPSAFDEAELRRLGVRRLPQSASAALEQMRSSAMVSSWVSPDLLETYTLLRRAEIEALQSRTPDDLAALYCQVF